MTVFKRGWSPRFPVFGNPNMLSYECASVTALGRVAALGGNLAPGACIQRAAEGETTPRVPDSFFPKAFPQATGGRRLRRDPWQAVPGISVHISLASMLAMQLEMQPCCHSTEGHIINQANPVSHGCRVS